MNTFLRSKNIKQSGLISSSPWLVGEDFNEIRIPKERIGKGMYNYGGPAEYIHATRMTPLLEMVSIGRELSRANFSLGPNFTQTKPGRDFSKHQSIDN